MYHKKICYGVNGMDEKDKLTSMLLMLGKKPGKINGDRMPWCTIEGIAYITIPFGGGIALVAFYMGNASIQYQLRDNNSSAVSFDELSYLLEVFNEAPELVKETMVLLLLGDEETTGQFIVAIKEKYGQNLTQ